MAGTDRPPIIVFSSFISQVLIALISRLLDGRQRLLDLDVTLADEGGHYSWGNASHQVPKPPDSTNLK